MLLWHGGRVAAQFFKELVEVTPTVKCQSDLNLFGNVSLLPNLVRTQFSR